MAFIAQLVALLVIGGICYDRYHTQFQSNQDPTDTTNNSNNLGPLEQAFPLIAVSIAAAVVQAAVWLWLMQRHGRILIWITLIFGLCQTHTQMLTSSRL